MTLLQNIEKEITRTEKDLKVYKMSFKLINRLALLLDQKEEIKKGCYMTEKRHLKGYYEETIYFKDGTCFSYRAPYNQAI